MAVRFETVVPNLKVTAYLLRAEIVDVEDALSAASRPGGREGMIEIHPRAGADLPQGTRAFVAMNRPRTPDWASALSLTFPDLAAVKNTSTRMILFLPVDGRQFAVCFGYGFSSLSGAAVDANFGLRYAARTFDSDVIFGLDSRRMSATARSQAVQTISGERLQDLDVPLAGEFVRRLAGRLDDGASREVEGIATVIASDGVAFKAGFELGDIRRVLSTMLEVVASREVKSEFEFVDALESLRSNDERIADLEERLCGALNRLLTGAMAIDEPLVGLAPPESPNVDLLDSVTCRIDGEAYALPDISLAGLLDVFRQANKKFSKTALRSVRLSVTDEHGEDRPAASLKSWLVFEDQSDERRYILTLGRWFALNEDFAARLDLDVSSIDDLTSALDLPVWPPAISETTYNREVGDSADNDYFRLDVRKFYSNGDEIEVCDLLSSSGHLVSVKKWDRSATLSHLFSQGLVAIEVLNRDAAYRADVEAFITAHSSAHLVPFQKRPRTVVYAVGMAGDKRMPLDLPTFSKVNLRDFAQRVKSRGADVAIARIQIA